MVRKWAEQEIDFLKNNYKSMTNKEISEELNWSTKSIYDKMYKLKLKREVSFRISERQIVELCESRKYKYVKSYRVKDVGGKSRLILELICPNGCDYKTEYGHFKGGHGCNCCSSTGIVLNEVIEQMYSEGYELEYIKEDKRRTCNITCPEGHNYDTSLYNWRKGSKCPECMEEKRKETMRETGRKMRGRLNPNYDEDRIIDHRKERTRSLDVDELTYRQWRKKVLKKDESKCIICEEAENIVVHHKNSWNWAVEDRFSVENGVCMCSKCHTDFHKEYGYGGNTEEQFDKYIKEPKKILNLFKEE